jgi:hypothetical protein
MQYKKAPYSIGNFFSTSVMREVYLDMIGAGNDSNKSKFDSGGNQEEIEFW